MHDTAAIVQRPGNSLVTDFYDMKTIVQMSNTLVFWTVATEIAMAFAISVVGNGTAFLYTMDGLPGLPIEDYTANYVLHLKPCISSK